MSLGTAAETGEEIYKMKLSGSPDSESVTEAELTKTDVFTLLSIPAVEVYQCQC